LSSRIDSVYGLAVSFFQGIIHGVSGVRISIRYAGETGSPVRPPIQIGANSGAAPATVSLTTSLESHWFRTGKAGSEGG